MMENPTVGKSSRSVDRTADTNNMPAVNFGMHVACWVTIGYYDNDISPTIYGPFPDMELAQDWLSKLTSGYVHVVYTPAYNRG